MKIIYERKEIEYGDLKLRVGDHIRYKRRKMVSKDGWQIRGRMVTETAYVYGFGKYAGNDIVWLNKGIMLNEKDLCGCVPAYDVIEKI